jgi:dolichol kinase
MVMGSNHESSFRLEFKRKSFHLIVGLSIAILTYFSEPVFGKIILIPILAGSLCLFILQHFKKNPINLFLTEHLERHKDARVLYKGAIFYGLGASIPILLLDRFSACAIIAILSVGDAASTIIGRAYGRHKLPGKKKSLEGTIAFIIFAVPASYLFLQNIWLSLAFSAIGSIVELFSPYDDNLAIPIVLTAIALLLQFLL